MNSFRRAAIDHYLIARCEARIDGANAHRLHGWIGNYIELCGLAEADPAVRPRVERLEFQLRSFCQNADRPCPRDGALGQFRSTVPRIA